MATIGDVVLKITNKPGGKEAVVDVRYDVLFDTYDQSSNQTYVEVCRLMGDDTTPDDPPAAGPDDTLGFLTPLFFRHTRSEGVPSLSRRWTRTFHLADLDEDRGPIPNPDEIRALVTLTPILPAATSRESNVVNKRI